MCRFLLYAGPPITLDKLITEPEHSLIRQSYKSRWRSEPLNGDGFGMAWYVPEVCDQPARYRSIRPAWSNANLQSITRVSRSSVVLAHVRAASPGLEVSQTNCHPFTNGRLAFMHNGSIGAFRSSKRAIQRTLSDRAFDAIDGSTDTEHAFAYFLDRYDQSEETEPLARMATALQATIHGLIDIVAAEGQPSDLNLAVSDGSHSVISRFSTEASNPSLFISRGREYTCEEGVCRMVDTDARGAAVVVASEPLSPEQSWEEVPPRSLVLVGADRRVEFRSL